MNKQMVMEQMVSFFKSVNLKHDSASEWVDEWEKNNSELIKLFKGNYFVEKQITCEKSFETTKRELKSFASNQMYSAEGDTFKYLVNNSSEEALKSGKFDYPKDDRCPDKYRAGMKMGKLLSMIVEDRADYNTVNGRRISRLENIQIELSKVIQGLKSVGYIGLSCHPLDYMTMSLNQNNWSSCHAPGGGYFGGCASYCFDKHSVIAYFHSGKKASYDFGEWNSKAWRQVIHIDPSQNMFVVSRQYPRVDENYAHQIAKMVEILLEGGNIEDEKPVNTWYVASKQRTINATLENTGLHYPDSEHGHDGVCRYRLNKDVDINRIVIGANPPCPDCMEEVDDSEEIGCCKTYNNRCYHCGEIHEEDEMTQIHGDWVCEDCRDDNYFKCERCGDWESNEEINDVNGEEWCDHCRRHYSFECDGCGRYFRNRDKNEHEGDCLCDECYTEVVGD